MARIAAMGVSRLFRGERGESNGYWLLKDLRDFCGAHSGIYSGWALHQMGHHKLAFLDQIVDQSMYE